MDDQRVSGEALLAAYRRAEAPDAETLESVARALALRQGAGVDPSPTQVSVPRLPGALARFAAYLPRPWLAALVVVPLGYAALGPRWQAAHDTQPTPKALAPVVPIAAVSVPPAPVPEPAPARGPAPAADPAPAETVRVRKAPRRAAPVRPEPTVDAEIAALRAANLQLKQRDPRKALTLLDDMDHSFPSGRLREPRTLTRVLALCAAGDPDAAAKVAAHFLETAPDSPYAARVRSSCIAR